MEQKKVLANQLFDIGAVKFGQFKLKLHEKNPKAPLSPFYIDLRLLRSFPDAMDSSIDIYQKFAKQLSFDLIADVPTAATPIVAVLSNRLRVPMISVRMDKKNHGTGHPIDGFFKSGQIALVIDDLITGADSKFAAISILENNGIIVKDIIVLLDREQGGVKELKTKGYNVICAMTITELLSILLEESKISKETHNKVNEYLNS
jgi:uridine monophosphate synthetase